MLKLSEISKTYLKSGEVVRALDNVSLEIREGEFVMVRGPSGSGKTTLLLAAGGLLKPDTGQILIAGQDPYALSPERRARLRGESIGFVFQQFHLVPYLTVLENVMTPSLVVRHGEARTRARELLKRFGLSERANHIPAELSTGERQRTALARALLNRPKIVLADEPTGNLDSENAALVIEHMAQFARAGGIVLLVTHFEEALASADRVIHINLGKITY